MKIRFWTRRMSFGMGRNLNLRTGVFYILLLLQACDISEGDDSISRKNILFISIDDLRPELGCYGNSVVKTPHIDELAGRGLKFDNAYCQQALCVPSRSSVFTGLRPGNAGVKYFGQHFRDTHPDLVTLPQFFREKGYLVKGVGKLFHHRDTLSWDERVWVPEPDHVYPLYALDSNRETQKEVIRNGRAFNKDPEMWWAKGEYWVPAHSWEAPDVSDDKLFDGMITTRAIEYLQQAGDQPFFVAVGLFRPHIPFIAPKKYYDLYPLDGIALPEDSVPPKGVPEIALHNWGETRKYTDIPGDGPISDLKKKELIRGYHASVSYIDAQIGRLVAALEELDLADNTMIVLWGDHGYHLGDLGLWGKYANFEQATRSPLIIHAPWLKSESINYSGIVELLDIYPTILDVFDYSVTGDLEGNSLKPIWENTSIIISDTAFSEYAKGGYTGFSVRVKDYRYTYWRPDDTQNTEEFFELYQYGLAEIEKLNLADRAPYQTIRNQLHRKIVTEFEL